MGNLNFTNLTLIYFKNDLIHIWCAIKERVGTLIYKYVYVYVIESNVQNAQREHQV